MKPSTENYGTEEMELQFQDLSVMQLAPFFVNSLVSAAFVMGAIRLYLVADDFLLQSGEPRETFSSGVGHETERNEMTSQILSVRRIQKIA